MPYKYEKLAEAISENVGGKENIVSAEFCATRIRFDLRDAELADEERLKKAGCLGVLRYGKSSVQVIVGQYVEHIFERIIRL